MKQNTKINIEKLIKALSVIFLIFLSIHIFQITKQVFTQEELTGSLFYVFFSHEIPFLLVFVDFFLSICGFFFFLFFLLFMSTSKSNTLLAKDVFIDGNKRSFKIKKRHLFQSKKRRLYISTSRVGEGSPSFKILNSLFTNSNGQFQKTPKDIKLADIEKHFLIDVQDENGTNIPFEIYVRFGGIRVDFKNTTGTPVLILSTKHPCLMNVETF